MGMTMQQIALVRPVSDALAQCELSFVERERIDVDLARRQHADYVDALRALGCEVVTLPTLHTQADAVFVEDVALVFDELAVLTRPGAESRRGEVASMAQALSPYRDVTALSAPALLDGGDVLRIGRDVYVGQGARSNAAAIDQLRALLTPHGYRVHGVRTRDCLHLKSAVTVVADDTVLINIDWLEDDLFGQYQRIAIDPTEPHAANALRVGDAVIHPDGFPRTTARLCAAGLHVITVDMRELQKAEGATTCCSVVLSQR